MTAKINRVPIQKKLFTAVRKANPDIADESDTALARIALNRLIPQEVQN